MGWGGWIPNHLVVSVCLLSAPILLSSWKLWDTLLELITAEWGKRWGETAEITFLLSLPLLSGLFGWTTVPAFCDGAAGWRWMGRNGGGGCHEGAADALPCHRGVMKKFSNTMKRSEGGNTGGFGFNQYQTIYFPRCCPDGGSSIQKFNSLLRFQFNTWSRMKFQDCLIKAYTFGFYESRSTCATLENATRWTADILGAAVTAGK